MSGLIDISFVMQFTFGALHLLTRNIKQRG